MDDNPNPTNPVGLLPCGCCYGSGIYKNNPCPDCDTFDQRFRAHSTPPELSTECKCDNGSWSSSPLGYMPPSYCKCAKTTPPSDGAAAPAGNGSHPSVGESVAVLPEGVMSAADFAFSIRDIWLGYSTRNHLEKTKALIEARDAQLSQAKGEGWVLVPREPTQKMIDAARLVWDEVTGEKGLIPDNMDFSGVCRADTIYRNMIAAAPQASEGEK